MKEKILPIGLKGYEVSERMKQLMGIDLVTENKKSSPVELTKLGPDGVVYGIVRENHEYYIKTATKTSNLTEADFSYIGGLKNKKDFAFPTYAKAIKRLNLKFHSLNESIGTTDKINVFINDNLLAEDIAGYCDSPKGNGFSNEGNLEGNAKSSCCGASEIDGVCADCGKMNEAEVVEEVEEALSETDQAVEDMGKVPVAIQEKKKLSIARSLDSMDSIIDGIFEGDKKKVYTIK